MNLDECRHNIGKVETKFTIANRPSDVVSRIHVYVDLDFKNHLKAGEAAVTYLKCLNGISCTHDKNLSIWQDLKICEYLFGQTNCHNPFVINYCLSDLTCLCCTKGLTTLANI